MNFELTPEQDALADSVRRFTEREYDFEKRKAILRSASGLNPAHWPAFAELGWLGAGLSEEAGGFGGGAVENALIAQEFGKALVTEPFVSHVVASQLLAAIPTPAAAELLGQLVMGEQRMAVACQEPDARGDFRQVSARAAGSAAGWTLDGAKSLVEGTASASIILVPATTENGVGLFMVDPSVNGLQRTDYRTVDNRRVTDIMFSGVQLGPEALLACGPDAYAAFERAMDHGIVTLCAEAVGIMDAALWATRDYLKVRKQFGVTLNNFQALQHRMADMLIEAEMTRSALFHALGAVENQDADARRAGVSALKVQVAKGGLFVGQQAIQLHGGIGVTEELIISHYYRRLFVIARQFGDMDLHLARFAQAKDRQQHGPG